MKALQEGYGEEIRFVGVGGDRMKKRGLKSLIPMEDLSVNGIVDVLPHLPRLLGYIWRLSREVMTTRPDIVITIDSPVFMNALAKRIRRHRPVGDRYPLIHVVAPTVWAWKPERAEKIAKIYDHLLVLFPFEVRYFRAGFATYIGHPVLELGIEEGDGVGFRRRHGIDEKAVILSVLPGSRKNEVRRFKDLLNKIIKRVKRVYPEIVVVISVLPDTQALIEGTFEDVILVGQQEKYDSFLASDLALAASGTIALELAVASVPAVIFYKIDSLGYLLGKYWYTWTIKFINIINIMLDEMVIPEFFQDRCDERLIAYTLMMMLEERSVRTLERMGYSRVLSELSGEGGARPSECAAKKILEIYHRHQG